MIIKLFILLKKHLFFHTLILSKKTPDKRRGAAYQHIPADYCFCYCN